MLSGRLGTPVQIILLGHTDSSGTESYNRRLSRDRADFVLALLMGKGISPSGMSTIGITSEAVDLRPDIVQDDNAQKRTVIFKTYYTIPKMEPISR
jgi:OOP family OmpA-OmpF porin